MSITITITDPTAEQIAALFGGQSANIPADKPAAKAKEPEAKAKPAAKAKEEPEVADEEGNLSLEDFKAECMKYAAKNGREALAEQLTKAGADKLSEVPEGKRQAVVDGF